MGYLAVLSLGLLLLPRGGQPSSDRRVPPSFRPLFSQAAQLRSQGEFAESYATLEQALALCGQDRTRTYQGKCLVRMGLLKWNLGEITESARLFGEAAAAFEADRDSISKGFCAKCLELIRIYEQAKNDRAARLYHRSVDRFNRACALGREIGFLDLQLKCLRQQAMAFLDMRELELFLENSKKGLEIAVAIRHRTEQGRCLNHIGVFYQQRHDYSKAVAHFNQALSIIRTEDDPETEAECLSNLGLAYRELGNLDRAHLYLSEALALDKRRGDVNAVSMDLDNIGTVLLRRGLDGDNEQDLRQALEAFQNGLRTQDQGHADPLIRFSALNNMGIILNEIGDHKAARLRFGQALRIADGEERVLERCHVLMNIASSHLDETNVEDALALYRMSYGAGVEHSFENVLMESCFGLGQCYERRHESALALSFYRRAIEAMETVRGRIASEPLMIGFSRNKLRPFERAVHILADQYALSPSLEGVAQMFDLVERAKAQAFLESVREARIDLSGPEHSILRERQQAISRAISELTAKLADHSVSESEEQALKNELELDEEEYVRLNSEMRATGRAGKAGWRQNVRRTDEIRRLLRQDDAVMLEYFLGEQQSYLILVSPAKVRLHLLPARGVIERSLRAYLRLISDRSSDPRAGFEAAERIGRELLPLDQDEELKRAKSIIVIPDGILHNLPFEAVRVRDEAGSRYLVEEVAVSYCPSASSLAVLKTSPSPGKRTKGVLAVGAPNYGRMTLRREGRRDAAGMKSGEDTMDIPPLPYSKGEVQDIAKSLASLGVDTLTGDAANENTIRQWPLKDYRIIHFACHGFLNESSPFRSALALSAADGSMDDGLLQMREIYELNLNADLVVLSACQTAAGRLERSEGLMGLARPFFFAGARSVIASLWPINDKSTVTFMHDFYTHLVGGRPAVEALREAKTKMLKSPWAHPFYWASFLFQGDPAAVQIDEHDRRGFLNAE
jgi:CHAT domain-containing protein/tetratricopeptide (TPR) repeat protein